MLRYENRQYWRQIESGGTVDFASDFPTQAVTEILTTGTVVVRALSVLEDGTAGEEFLVGVVQAGSTPVKVRHGTGLALVLYFAKGVECWVYDDREDHQAAAPVGVSFTVFEQPGHIFNDPVQLLIQRDANVKALQRMAARDNPEPDRMAQLEQQNARLIARLEKLEQADAEQEAADGGAESGAEA